MDRPRYDFFISYNKADGDWAAWIAWQLEENGYLCVLQAWDFHPGQDFIFRMHKASTEAQRTIAVLSDEYLKAQFTTPEWTSAFSLDPTGEKGLLVPARVRTCNPTGLLRARIYIDLVGLDEVSARQALVDGITNGRLKPLSAPRFPSKGRSGQTYGRPRYPNPGSAQESSAAGPALWKSPSAAKDKLSVPIDELVVDVSSANGESFIHSFEHRLKTIDPNLLLRSARVRPLAKEQKKQFVVIKFSYVLVDYKEQRVSLIDRVLGRHERTVGEHSLLLSSGLDRFFSAQHLLGELILNSYQPFTKKLGALVNEFELPILEYNEFPTPVRFSALAVRKKEGCYYAFFIHFARLVERGRFPKCAFPLEYPESGPDLPPDLVQGFFPFEEADRLLRKSDFIVDRFALSLLMNRRFKADGLVGRLFKPRL